MNYPADIFHRKHLHMSDLGKILLVANTFPPKLGGSAVVYGNLARQSGGRMIVIAPREDYTDGLPIIGWREHDRTSAYPVVRPRLLRTVMGDADPADALGRMWFIAGDLLQRARLLSRLLRIIFREGIVSICIGEIVTSNWIVRFFHRFTKVRTAIYIHGEELLLEGTYDPHHERTIKALRAADNIFVVSGFTAEAVRGLIGDDRLDRIHLIENGVDTHLFHPGPQRADLLATYGLDGCFVFVTVCRLIEKKGVDTAIRAMVTVGQRHPEARLLVVGEGPYLADLVRLARMAGVDHQVVFAGKVTEEDLVDHYRLGDVFIMANRALPNGDTEGFGLVFLEANACGIAVIGGQDGGTSSAVRHGENGLLVDGHSVDAVADAMMTLREDPELRARMGRNGLRIAQAAGWEHKAAAVLAACLDTPIE